jgi:putative ABC transport system permease protein
MTSAVLTRLIRLQREQIAQLKAFGYASGQIGWHYLKFALVIVMIASTAGVLLGLWLGNQVVIIYHRFYHSSVQISRADCVVIFIPPAYPRKVSPSRPRKICCELRRRQ